MSKSQSSPFTTVREDGDKDCRGCTASETVRTYRTKNGRIHGRVALCDDCVTVVRMREPSVRLE